MFENMDEKQAKEKIFELVTEYYNKYQREKRILFRVILSVMQADYMMKQS